MINKSLSQKGNAHVVIIVILVITLVGALGFVFWQNFTNKESSENKVEVTKNDQTKVVEEPIDKYAGWKTGTFKNANISYKLPQNWQDISDNTQFQDNYIYEEVKIRALDGFTLSMSINNLPRGGEYMPTMPKVLEFKNIDDTYQWIIADDAAGKVNRIYVGNGITSVGEETPGYALIQRNGMNIEFAASYDYTMKFDSLSAFNEKETVKEAKLVFESLKFN